MHPHVAPFDLSENRPRSSPKRTQFDRNAGDQIFVSLMKPCTSEEQDDFPALAVLGPAQARRPLWDLYSLIFNKLNRKGSVLVQFILDGGRT